jgi:hypothetical protein
MFASSYIVHFFLYYLLVLVVLVLIILHPDLLQAPFRWNS